MTDAPDDESKLDSSQPAAGVFGSGPQTGAKSPGLPLPKPPAAGVFGGGGGAKPAAGVFGSAGGAAKPLGIPGGAPSAPGSVFGAAKPAAPAGAGAFGGGAFGGSAAGGAFGAPKPAGAFGSSPTPEARGPAEPAAPTPSASATILDEPGLDELTVDASTSAKRPSAPPLGPAPIIPKPRGPLGSESPSNPGFEPAIGARTGTSPGMPAVGGPFTSKSPSTPGMPAVGTVKSPATLGFGSPEPKASPAPTPAFQIAPRPVAPPSSNESVEFPATDAQAKSSDGSLLTLLPLEPEASKSKAPLPPSKTGSSIPAKAQIGGGTRPSVLGTSKLSPTAKTPAKTPATGGARPEASRTSPGRSVAPSTLSASLNQRTSNSVVGPLPKAPGVPQRAGGLPVPTSPGALRGGIPAASYQRTGNSVVGPLPRPTVGGSSPGTPRPDSAAGVKVAATTAVGTPSLPPAESTPEARVGNAQAAAMRGNVGARRATMVGFQQPGQGSSYERGADGSRSQPSFSDDFDDQPTLIGEAIELEELAASNPPDGTALPVTPKVAIPVVPAADEFENAPRIRSSALGLLVPSEVIGKTRETEPLDLSDDDLIPSNSLPPIALPPTSPHMQVAEALLDPEEIAGADFEPGIDLISESVPLGTPAIAPPSATPAQAQAALPVAPVVQAAAAPSRGAQVEAQFAAESTLITRGRSDDGQNEAEAPKSGRGAIVAGFLLVAALGGVGGLVASGTIKLPGAESETAQNSQTAQTEQIEAAPTQAATDAPQVVVAPDAGAAAPVADAGAVDVDAANAVDAGAAAVADAGVAIVEAPEPPAVEAAPTPAADPSDLSGITPDSQLPSSGPRASDILVRDALSLMEQNRLDAANVALTRAMERDRINPQGFEALAKYHLLRGDASAAITAANQAVSLRSSDSRYLVILGDAQLAGGDRGAARASWTRAVSMDRNRDARARLAANP